MLYLKEKITEKDGSHDKETSLISTLNGKKIEFKTELFYLQEKIRCFSFTMREMNEDIFSLDLAANEKERLEKLRERVKVLGEILEERINDEKIIHNRLEPIKKEIESRLSKQHDLYEEARYLRGEYEPLLLTLTEDDLPKELLDDYLELRYLEEHSDDNSIEEEEEPEELKIKTFFVYNTCCVCQEEKPSIFNIPCGHVCLCISCNAKNASINYDNCAICRKYVRRYYDMKRL